MEKKPKPFASKAQSERAYRLYKEGKIGYEDLMKSVHVTDFNNIPERVKERVDKKIDISIKGLI